MSITVYHILDEGRILGPFLVTVHRPATFLQVSIGFPK